VIPILESKKKQSGQGYAPNDGTQTCDKRMPFDIAEREIDHRAD